MAIIVDVARGVEARSGCASCEDVTGTSGGEWLRGEGLGGEGGGEGGAVGAAGWGAG